jgi:hypothetical protein
MLNIALKKYNIFVAIKQKSESFRERLANAASIKQTRQAVELEATTSLGQTYKKKKKGGDSYREAMSTFDGARYDFDCVIVDKRPIKQVDISDLKWILDHVGSLDQSRIDAADIAAPILVVKWHDQLATIDGVHQLAKAVANGVKILPAREITNDELQQCAIGQKKSSPSGGEIIVVTMDMSA